MHLNYLRVPSIRNDLFFLGSDCMTELGPKENRMWWMLWVLWSVVIILVAIVPLSNFVGHSHWDYVVWIPLQDFFNSPEHRLDLSFDLVANVLLFLPFGYIHPQVRRSRKGGGILFVVVTAAIFSAGLELYQVFNHTRTVSMTDVSCNALGAAVGAVIALKQRQQQPTRYRSHPKETQPAV